MGVESSQGQRGKEDQIHQPGSTLRWEAHAHEFPQ
jgi:hypothetical protein